MASKPTPLTDEEWAKVAEDLKSQLHSSPNWFRREYQTGWDVKAYDTTFDGRDETYARLTDGMLNPPHSVIKDDILLSNAVFGINAPSSDIAVIKGRQAGMNKTLAGLDVMNRLSDSMKLSADAMKRLSDGFSAAMINSGSITTSKITGTDASVVIMDELFTEETDMSVSTNLAIDELEGLARQMTEYFTRERPTKSLLSPASLTVANAKGFRKQNHIGGEHFIFESVRIGSSKKGSRLIFVFRPDAVANYSQMEMDENDATNLIEDFRIVANEAVKGNFAERVREIRNIDVRARQEQEAKVKMAEDPEYGSW